MVYQIFTNLRTTVKYIALLTGSYVIFSIGTAVVSKAYSKLQVICGITLYHNQTLEQIKIRNLESVFTEEERQLYEARLPVPPLCYIISLPSRAELEEQVNLTIRKLESRRKNNVQK